MTAILLTGATGFVGRALYPALKDARYETRCLSRNPSSARERWPDREWVGGDLERPETLDAAFAGCEAAFYLVHSMGQAGGDFRERERRSARNFTEAAYRAGAKRILYLGGIPPTGTLSEHFASRMEVGEILRSGSVPTLELRAGVIVGHGSLSWMIVRDLTARLPVMILPAWMKSVVEVVSIEDVILALMKGLEIPLPESAVFDLPGPERMSSDALLVRTAKAMGIRPPLMLSVPFLSLGLSSHWVRWVTRADGAVATELVLGLRSDMREGTDDYWELIGHLSRLNFEEAAKRALKEEPNGAAPGAWGVVERVVKALFRER